MGGLIALYAMQFLGLADSVGHWFAMGSPFHGTQLPHAAGKGLADSVLPDRFSGSQMAPGSRFIRKLLSKGEVPDGVKVTTVRSSRDEIVFPVASASLDGAQNYVAPNGMHLSLLVDPRVMDLMVRQLAA